MPSCYSQNPSGMQPDKMLYRTLQGTSKFSITGKGNRPGSGSCLLPLLNDGSMKNDWRHEMFGTHPVDAYFSLVHEARKNRMNHIWCPLLMTAPFLPMIIPF